MALTFQPLKCDRPDLFGVALGGSYGRGDKDHLLDLARKCLDKGRVHVLLDVSGLKNLGGGGASACAAFQKLLVGAGGGAVFVGANETILKYLAAKFEGLELVHHPDLAAAMDAMSVTAEDAGPEPEPELDTGTEVPDEETPAPEETAPLATESQEVDDSSLATFSEMMPEVVPVTDRKPDLPEEAHPLDSSLEALDGDGEVGAVGFCAEDFEFDESEGDSCEVEDEEEVPAAELETSDAKNQDGPAPERQTDSSSSGPKGRRREHSYTSLSDAISALGGWSRSEDDQEYGHHLENLLFSHGLAESALFLPRREGRYQDADCQWGIPEEGSLATQLFDRSLPLTLLDIQDEDLAEGEIALLEGVCPDIMVPVRADGEPAAILMLKRQGEGEEYSVVEHFALELLMRVLSGEETGTAGGAEAVDKGESGHLEQELELVRQPWSEAAAGDDTLAEVLLHLALELPDADDRPHFWRIISRNIWPVFPVTTLAFLGPEKRKSQVMVGQNEELAGVNLGVSHMKVFFQTMERPVAASNLPDFFKETKKAILDAGIDWIVTLRWEDQYLGTLLLGVDEAIDSESVGLAELIHELFGETARMLARFDDSHENADQNLDLVTLLLGQREKRMFGGDEMTRSLVSHMRMLARAMGFPPDQERDLIHGCLLRDVGLIDKDDEMSGSPERLDPVQWSLYKRHPEEGARLLEGVGLSPAVVEAVRFHHERFGGEGFPRGLSGREIPLAARVVTVVESYVNMVVGSDVREPVSPQDAARIMHDNLGKRYDPELVQIFLRAIMPENSWDLVSDPA